MQTQHTIGSRRQAITNTMNQLDTVYSNLTDLAESQLPDELWQKLLPLINQISTISNELDNITT